jgi:hypothetical protein
MMFIRKGFFLCLLMLASTAFISAQAPEWLWAARGGGSLDDYGYSIAVDNAGNSYVCGHFQNTADFGVTNLTSAGDYDIFVAKLDTNGNWLWAKRAGGTGHESSYSICTDASGNCYLSGAFQGTADFGPFSLTSAGGADAIIAKLDTDGNWLWAVRAGGTGATDVAWNIAADTTQNCYVTGVFMGLATFGTTTLTSAGVYDVFVAKLNESGQWQWATRAGGPASEQGYGIALDNGGNVYIAGYFAGTADFYMNLLTSSGVEDIFVAKLDPNGYFQWAVQAGGSGTDGALWLDVDGDGNCYLTGPFSATATFGISSLTSLGSTDIFVSKVDTNGVWQWTKRAGGTSVDQGNGICVDVAGGVYIAATISGTSDFGDYGIACLGGYDIVAAKLDNSGNWSWVLHTGSTGNEAGYEVAVCSGGNIYLTGPFSLTVPFGATSLTSVGARDVWVAKLSPSTPVDDDLAPGLSSESFLYAAWPNPFHAGETATVKASVADGESGTITLYNTRGQVIQRKQLCSGCHQISIGGTDLPAGIYLYRLSTPTVNTIRKLVLLK